MRSARNATLWALAALGTAGCATAEESFTDGRIENLCNGAIPVCSTQGGCVLQPSEYIRGAFPGGFKVIVRTPNAMSRLIVRFLLLDPTFGGSEFQVTANDTGCSDYSEEHPRDRNILEYAGDDGIMEFHLDVRGRGDHLVQVFGDLGAQFVMTVEVTE